MGETPTLLQICCSSDGHAVLQIAGGQMMIELGTFVEIILKHMVKVRKEESLIFAMLRLPGIRKWWVPSKRGGHS